MQRTVHVNKILEDIAAEECSSDDDGDERVPPGAVHTLRNKMQFVWYELTEDGSDPLVNKPNKAILPSSLKDVGDFQSASERTATTGLKNCLAFSHVVGSRKEFENTECMYSPNKDLHPIIDGVVMDMRSAELLKEGDMYVDVSNEGNILAIHIMPEGWVKHYHLNGVCNRCGKFPSYGRCFTCGCGSFCSPECTLMSKRDGTHSVEACKHFIKKRVELANPIIVEKEENNNEAAQSIDEEDDA